MKHDRDSFEGIWVAYEFYDGPFLRILGGTSVVRFDVIYGYSWVGGGFVVRRASWVYGAIKDAEVYACRVRHEVFFFSWEGVEPAPFYRR